MCAIVEIINYKKEIHFYENINRTVGKAYFKDLITIKMLKK